jgi:mono/diheme cytochrome c family protein
MKSTACRFSLLALVLLWQGPLHAAGDAHKGRLLYRQNCMVCHGVQGRGDGIQAKWLKHQPMNFTDPVRMKGETDEDMTGDVQNGVPNSEMPAWKDKLKLGQIRDILAYVRVLEKAGRHAVRK